MAGKTESMIIAVGFVEFGLDLLIPAKLTKLHITDPGELEDVGAVYFVELSVCDMS